MVSQTANTPSEAAISSITDIGRSRGALVGGCRRLWVFDGDDIPGFFPCGRLYAYFGIQGLTDQGAGQWGIDADLLGFQVQFVGADDAIARLVAVVILQAHPGAEVDLIRVAGAAVDDLEVLQTLG